MRIVFLCLWIAAISREVTAADAGLVAEVRDAARKLGEQANYSWTATPKSGGPNLRPGITEGKTEKNGFTYFKMAAGQNAVEAAFGGRRSAIKTEDRWESAEELQGERAWVARRLSSFRVPAAEAEDLLSKSTGLTKASGVYTGNLTALGVRQILLNRRVAATEKSEPVSTKGWVKFWIKDGMLAKYEYNLEGKMVANQQAQIIDISLTMSVEIKDVGSTRVQIPEEARKKIQ